MWGFIAISLCVNGQLISGPIVDTNLGTVVGTVGPDFTSFLGIPYGVVDEKDPFATANPAPAFNEPFIANKDPVICPQMVKGVPTGNIQCLNLNVYTPNNVTAYSNLPVMIFVHGGGFVEGNGNLKTYSPKFLINNNVIVVTINYRLGVYGFLCIPELNYSNQGILDQALAFDWVARNIRSFGGNGNDITVFGHSAGSGSVDIHLLFNRNKVFNKVILQSGSAVSPIMIKDAANAEYITEIAKTLNVDVEDKILCDITNELSNIDTDKLIKITGNDEFRPCIDDVFIKKTVDISLSGIKIIIGDTERDALFFYNDNDNTEQFFNYLPKEYDVDRVKDYYFNNSNTKKDAVEFGTDLIFNYPIERSLRYYEENADVVYRYVFSYDGKRNYIKVRDNITDVGATHGDELGYIFDAYFLGYKISKSDQIVIDSMTRWWTNFAKYGKPGNSWPAVNRESKYYMNIGERITVEKNYFNDKIELWDELYSMYGACFRGIDYGEDYKCTRNRGRVLSSNFIYSVIVLYIICI